MLKGLLNDDDETREEDAKAIELLTQTNNQLNEDINNLKNQYKDYASPEEYQKLKDELNALDEKCNMLAKEK